MEDWILMVTNKIEEVMYGDTYILSCKDKDEVIENLNSLKEDKQDMDYVYIYPPKSNIELEELI